MQAPVGVGTGFTDIVRLRIISQNCAPLAVAISIPNPLSPQHPCTPGWDGNKRGEKLHPRSCRG